MYWYNLVSKPAKTPTFIYWKYYLLLMSYKKSSSCDWSAGGNAVEAEPIPDEEVEGYVEEEPEWLGEEYIEELTSIRAVEVEPPAMELLAEIERQGDVYEVEQEKDLVVLEESDEKNRYRSSDRDKVPVPV